MFWVHSSVTAAVPAATASRKLAAAPAPGGRRRPLCTRSAARPWAGSRAIEVTYGTLVRQHPAEARHFVDPDRPQRIGQRWRPDQLGSGLDQCGPFPGRPEGLTRAPRLSRSRPAARLMEDGAGRHDSAARRQQFVQSGCGRADKDRPHRRAVLTISGTVLPLCYDLVMAVRKKRSVSIPPDLDAQIEAAATEAGMTYSAWLAATARKEFTIQAGLKAIAEFEDEQGAFSPEEIAEAEQWARDALEPSSRGGSRRRRSA